MTLCKCCGCKIPFTNCITSYWLQGKSYVWLVCYVCWFKPFLKALFLNSKGDITDKLIKRFGNSLGYVQMQETTK